MKLSEHKELKQEILGLPPKEKDKLLLRLVAKDKVLTEHLHFLLLEDEADLKERVTAIKADILAEMNVILKLKNDNPKEVLTQLRKLVKLVNHNFKVTKAKFEDVALRVYLFNNCITKFRSGRFYAHKNYEQLFAVYFIKATLVTLRKFEKLHEDLQFDLKEEFNQLLQKIYSGYMANIAHDLHLPEQIE